MSKPLITPDFAYVLAAVIATGPAYIMARRSSKKADKAESTVVNAESTKHAEQEHERTRAAMVDALNAVVGPLNGRLDEMHATIADMHAWQADHALQHATAALKRSPILEFRKGE
jgi:hypothetical protein